MGWTSSADPLENVGRSALVFYVSRPGVVGVVFRGRGYSEGSCQLRRRDSSCAWRVGNMPVAKEVP